VALTRYALLHPLPSGAAPSAAVVQNRTIENVSSLFRGSGVEGMVLMAPSAATHALSPTPQA